MDPSSGPAWTAGQVAQQLGISESTLRTWHRRYGLDPRDAEPGHYRRYRAEDVARLRRMLELINGGMLASEAARAVQAGAPDSVAPAREVELLVAAAFVAVLEVWATVLLVEVAVVVWAAVDAAAVDVDVEVVDWLLPPQPARRPAPNKAAIASPAADRRADVITSGTAFVGISIAILGGKGWEQADDWAALFACALN